MAVAWAIIRIRISFTWMSDAYVNGASTAAHRFSVQAANKSGGLELLLEQDGNRASVGDGAEYYGEIEFAIAVEVGGDDLERIGSDGIG